MSGKKDKTAPTFVHWIGADPYARTVCSITGGLSEGLRQIESRLMWKGFRDDVYPVMSEEAPKDLCPGPFCMSGRTVETPHKDIVMWFPRFPAIPVLVHELEHAMRFVLDSAGVCDKNGEADAYLLAFLTGHFTKAIGRDIERRMPKVRWV